MARQEGVSISTCAAEDVTGWHKRQRHSIDRQRSVIGDGLTRPRVVRAIAGAHDVQRFGGRQHRAVTRPRVVGMTVRDDRPFDGTQRIDVETAGRAIQSGIGQGEKFVAGHGDEADKADFENSNPRRAAMFRRGSPSQNDRTLTTVYGI